MFMDELPMPKFLIRLAHDFCQRQYTRALQQTAQDNPSPLSRWLAVGRWQDRRDALRARL
jgi:hypothetical protein